jgi:hypothetical protein
VPKVFGAVGYEKEVMDTPSASPQKVTELLPHWSHGDKVRASPAASTANPFYPRNPRLICQCALFGKRISNKKPPCGEA